MSGDVVLGPQGMMTGGRGSGASGWKADNSAHVGGSGDSDVTRGVRVPYDYIGVVIGSKGRTKDHLEKTSGARISIDNRDGMVSLTGTPLAVATAVDLINERVRSAKAGGGDQSNQQETFDREREHWRSEGRATSQWHGRDARWDEPIPPRSTVGKDLGTPARAASPTLPVGQRPLARTRASTSAPNLPLEATTNPDSYSLFQWNVLDWKGAPQAAPTETSGFAWSPAHRVDVDVSEPGEAASAPADTADTLSDPGGCGLVPQEDCAGDQESNQAKSLWKGSSKPKNKPTSLVALSSLSKNETSPEGEADAAVALPQQKHLRTNKSYLQTLKGAHGGKNSHSRSASHWSASAPYSARQRDDDARPVVDVSKQIPQVPARMTMGAKSQSMPHLPRSGKGNKRRTENPTQRRRTKGRKKGSVAARRQTSGVADSSIDPRLIPASPVVDGADSLFFAPEPERTQEKNEDQPYVPASFEELFSDSSASAEDDSSHRSNADDNEGEAPAEDAAPVQAEASEQVEARSCGQCKQLQAELSNSRSKLMEHNSAVQELQDMRAAARNLALRLKQAEAQNNWQNNLIGALQGQSSLREYSSGDLTALEAHLRCGFDAVRAEQDRRAEHERRMEKRWHNTAEAARCCTSGCSNPVSVVFLPCMHAVLCKRCWGIQQHNQRGIRCSECGGLVTAVQNLYASAVHTAGPVRSSAAHTAGPVRSSAVHTAGPVGSSAVNAVGPVGSSAVNAGCGFYFA